jgi:predicted phage-related endonuclease
MSNPLQSDEWRQKRCGKVGASSVHRVMATTKTGFSADRASYMAELICERLTGTPADRFVSRAMQDGIDREASARAMYEFQADVTVNLVGWVPHPKMPEDAGSSPDGRVDDDGLVEIKCPQPAAHLETLLGGAVPYKYITQMQWQMACTGRKWCDFVSFDPRMSDGLQLFVKRVDRDDAYIQMLEKEVVQFLTELDGKIKKLNELKEKNGNNL